VAPEIGRAKVALNSTCSSEAIEASDPPPRCPIRGSTHVHCAPQLATRPPDARSPDMLARQNGTHIDQAAAAERGDGQPGTRIVASAGMRPVVCAAYRRDDTRNVQRAPRREARRSRRSPRIRAVASASATTFPQLVVPRIRAAECDRGAGEAPGDADL
jgi:hypothetical protein